MYSAESEFAECSELEFRKWAPVSELRCVRSWSVELLHSVRIFFTLVWSVVIIYSFTDPYWHFAQDLSFLSEK